FVCCCSRCVSHPYVSSSPTRRSSDLVLVFSKSEIARTFDEGDNFGDRRAIVYARNACFELARQIGATHFIELDDDYTYFKFRFEDRKSTRLNSSHVSISYAVFCLKKK